MDDRGVDTVGRGEARDSAQNRGFGTSNDEPVQDISPPAATDANALQFDAIVAGLPAPLMDELVEDMAEAVVAMLLREAAAEPDEEDDASRDLR